MTLSTLRALTRQLVGDPQGSTYSQEMYQDAINFACKEYAKKTGSTYVETAVNLDTLTGLCAIPTAYMRINRVITNGVPVYGDGDSGGVYRVLEETNSTRVDSTYYSYGYLSESSCFVFPDSITTLRVKPETVTVMDYLGSPVRTISAVDTFVISSAAPDFTLSSGETAKHLREGGVVHESSGYVDFHVIVERLGDSIELKMRYVNPGF